MKKVAKMYKRRGFSLAEVLLTLAIISVVAAMTIPTVVNIYQDAQYKTSYQKAYSDANNALTAMLKDYEYQIRTGDYDNSATVNNFTAFKNKFRVQKECFSNNRGECFALSNVYPGSECLQGVLDGEGNFVDAGVCTYSSPLAFIDSSGRSWTTYSNTENAFLVDTNGGVGPNKLGKDRWVFSFTSRANKQYTSLNAEYVMPTHNDYVIKSRICPSGDCKYCTWLFGKTPCH